MTNRPECTTVVLRNSGGIQLELIACDVHGNGRSNKCWTTQTGNAVNLPNLKAVADYAKKNNLKMEKVYEN